MMEISFQELCSLRLTHYNVVKPFLSRGKKKIDNWDFKPHHGGVLTLLTNGKKDRKGVTPTDGIDLKAGYMKSIKINKDKQEIRVHTYEDKTIVLNYV